MQSDYVPTRLTQHRPPPRVAPVTAPGRFRTIVVAAAFGGFAIRLLGMTLARASATEKAQALRQVLERLGAFWIKVGQLFSMRHDLFSFDFCQELSKLQDVAPGAEFSQIKAIVEEELGGPIENFFGEFSEAPFAAASIGQLHLARLRTSGVQVAVKVQKPFVPETTNRDLRILYWVSRFCLALGILRFYNWEEFYHETERIVIEELDYRYEAAAMRRMRRTLKAHGVIVPRPYRDLCTGRMLVMEYISGCLLADYFRVQSTDPKRIEAWIAENNIQPKKVVKRLLNSHWRQVFEDNFFHGDLHGGNIVLLRDSRVALLDFGSVGRLDTSFHDSFLRYNQAVANGNIANAAELFLMLAPSLPPGDLERPRREFIRFIRSWILLSETPGIPSEEKNAARVLDRILQILSRYEIPVAWDLLRINRARASLDSSIRGLYPDFQEIVLNKKYFREARERRLRRNQNPAKIAERTVEAISGLGQLIGDGAEAATLELSWMRRRAQTLALASRKASALVVVGIDLICLAALGVTGGLALLWLHQRGIYRAPSELTESFTGVLHLTTGDWALVAVISVLVLARLFAARAQIRQVGQGSSRTS